MVIPLCFLLLTPLSRGSSPIDGFEVVLFRFERASGVIPNGSPLCLLSHSSYIAGWRNMQKPGIARCIDLFVSVAAWAKRHLLPNPSIVY